jgi:GxxExxY protein
MDADERRSVTDAITESVIGAAYAVANTLGNGFLEKVYENALAIELRQRGVPFEQQKSLQVLYHGAVVGEYVADLVVSELVIVELKAVKQLDSSHQAQCMNYLKATGIRVALLINFGSPRVELRRIVNDF